MRVPAQVPFKFAVCGDAVGLRGLDHFDAVGGADFAQLGRNELVGDEGVDFRHMSDTDRRSPFKLRLIANEQTRRALSMMARATATSRGS